jgi:hypothetical protein
MSKPSKKINKDEQAAMDVYEDLIERCKNIREFKISCYLDEAWVPNGVMPFDILIRNGLVTCKVYAESKLEAALMVAHELPVIVFLDDDEIDY